MRILSARIFLSLLAGKFYKFEQRLPFIKHCTCKILKQVEEIIL